MVYITMGTHAITNPYKERQQ